MENESQVFVYLAPEIQQDLADNSVNLIDLLKQAGLEVSEGLAEDSIKPKDSGAKGDPVTVILASSAVVAVLTPTILKVIEALSSRAVIVQRVVTESVTDPQGKPIQDSYGKPILQQVKYQEILEPTKEISQSNQYISLEFLGFKFEYKRDIS